MPQDTIQAVAILENIPYSTRIDDFMEETNVKIDIASVLIDIPINPNSKVVAELPFSITYTFYFNENELIDSVAIASEQALPLAATIAGNGLSASGVLPYVTHEDSCEAEQVILNSSFEFEYGTFTVNNNTWTFTSNQTVVVPPGEHRNQQVTVWSEGPLSRLPRFHPWLYVDELDRKETDPPSDYELPQAVIAFGGGLDTSGEVPPFVSPFLDPFFGRVPGSDPKLLVHDQKIGIQEADLYLPGDTNPGGAACC